MKLWSFFFCAATLTLSDIYLINKTSTFKEHNASLSKAIKAFEELRSELLHINKNIAYLRKRLSYFYECNDNQFCEVIKSMVAMCDGSTKEVKLHKQTISLNALFPSEKKLNSFILTFIHKAPFLIHITKSFTTKNENAFTLQLQANFNKIKTKKNTYFQIDSPIDGFEILDNTLTASCVIIDDNKKLTQINDNWFEEGDQFDNFTIKGIYEDQVLIHSKKLKKDFTLKIGEKTVICP